MANPGLRTAAGRGQRRVQLDCVVTGEYRYAVAWETPARSATDGTVIG
jgi:hypothetical protein